MRLYLAIASARQSVQMIENSGDSFRSTSGFLPPGGFAFF
jgi:hypothetical protein